METHEGRRSPVDRQLEVYRESWQADHHEAMACYDWEEVIAVGVSTFRLLQQREDTWRERVFRGTLAFDPQHDQDHRTRLTLWLTVTDAILRAVIGRLERNFGRVEGADDLRQCATKAQHSLHHWESPRLSAAVGLREMTLSREAAQEMERLLAKARTSPPEKFAEPPMQQLSAEEFLDRKRANRK